MTLPHGCSARSRAERPDQPPAGRCDVGGVPARDESLGRRVVIKVLPGGVASADAIDRFRREDGQRLPLQRFLIDRSCRFWLPAGRRRTALLRHAVCRGEWLSRRLARGPLSVRESVSVLVDVARALAFAHERGVIHRDIKRATSSSPPTPPSSRISASPKLAWQPGRPAAARSGTSRATARSHAPGHLARHADLHGG